MRRDADPALVQLLHGYPEPFPRLAHHVALRDAHLLQCEVARSGCSVKV